ncbi:MAG: SCO4402 family protein [Roseiarcus sp.]
MNKLIYPEARANIDAAIEGLADTELQQRAWIGRNARPVGECPTFSDALHWLFDDSGLDDGVYTCIGYMLYNEAEARSVDGLMKQLDHLLQKYGYRLPDKNYINTPEWPSIVAAAAKCLQLFRDNDRKFQSALPAGDGSAQ